MQNSNELDDLIFELLDGVITPDRHQKLQTILKGDPAARQRYRDLTSLDNLLEEHKDASSMHFSYGPQQNLIPFERLARRQRQRIAMWSAAAAAAVLLISAVIMMVISVENTPRVATMRYAEHTDFNVIHPDKDGNYEEGEIVAGSKVELKQGSMELDLTTGVKAVVKAPALFTVNDNKSIDLQSGSGWFTVSPKGHGFTVRTPQMEVVDLGTEFGVVVDPGLALEQVHVLHGRVQVSAMHRMKESKMLTAGQACQVSVTGALEDIVPDNAKFLQGLPKGLTYLEWDFDHKDDGEIIVGGSMSERQDVKAYVVRGAIKTVDGKSGLARKFTKTGGYIQTTWPGVDADRPRTISCWVKYPSDGEVSNGAVIEWGIPQQNAAKWRITVNPSRSEGVRGAMRTEFGFGYVIGTTDLRDGKWHHLVSVYNGSGRGDTDSIKLYVDGKLEKVSASKLNRVGTLVGRPGADPCLIGKNFRGSIDSLRVYQGAYPEKDIPALMNE